MNRKLIFWLLLLLSLLMLEIFYIRTAEGKEKPLPFIDNPSVVEKNHKVTIGWYQLEPVLVTVYKLSSTRRLKNDCSGVETFGYQCQVLWQRSQLRGNIRVTDRNYKGGDQYYIQQNVYQSHNGGYGPFIPTYR